MFCPTSLSQFPPANTNGIGDPALCPPDITQFSNVEPPSFDVEPKSSLVESWLYNELHKLDLRLNKFERVLAFCSQPFVFAASTLTDTPYVGALSPTPNVLLAANFATSALLITIDRGIIVLLEPSIILSNNTPGPNIPSEVNVGSIKLNEPPDQMLPPAPIPPLITLKAPVVVLTACVGSLTANWLLIVPPEKLLIVAAVIIGLPLIQPALATRK